ncbi:MAG: hypothetical protein CMC38_07610 [Flavobacteriaceae bacterium]|mgnify:FL=1|nr:hypothetical protein [Flavobacteriaceae bacterium]|tara:strand:+ start:2871 stop:3221 length:351 start_codon:yes stop_codon:yes gene_type:complete
MFKKITLLYTLFIICISLIPIPKLVFPGFSISDKSLHLIAYLIMSIMWIRLGFIESKKIKWNYFLLVLSIALITEILQGILPIGRYFEIADILANCIGLLLGFGVSYFYIIKNKVT